MPNAIKYSTTGDTQSLKKGNFYFGVGDVGKGPTSSTNYWNGITPPTGGYTIYINKASGGPSIYVATGDTQLINYTNKFSGQNFTGATQCLNWYLTQTDYACVNMDYEGIVTNGLIFNLDAGFVPSYTSSGTSWYDVSYGSNTGTLTNGPLYDSANKGSISFDGIDDKITCGTNISTSNLQVPFSVDLWVNADTVGNTTTPRGLFSTSNPVALNAYYGIMLQLGSGNDGAGRYTVFFGTGNGVSLGTTGRQSLTTTNKDITGGTWCHVVGTITTGPTFKIYVNGTERTGTISGTGSGINWGTNTPTTIGQNNGSSLFFKGKIANVKFYNTLLSPTQVLQNFNAQKSRFGL